MCVPSTARLLTLNNLLSSRTHIRTKYKLRHFARTNQYEYLDKVEKAIKNAVFRDKLLSSRVSFSPKSAKYFKTRPASYVHRYLGRGGHCCQNAFLACWTRGWCAIVSPVCNLT